MPGFENATPSVYIKTLITRLLIDRLSYQYKSKHMVYIHLYKKLTSVYILLVIYMKTNGFRIY